MVGLGLGLGVGEGGLGNRVISHFHLRKSEFTWRKSSRFFNWSLGCFLLYFCNRGVVLELGARVFKGKGLELG